MKINKIHENVMGDFNTPTPPLSLTWTRLGPGLLWNSIFNVYSTKDK